MSKVTAASHKECVKAGVCWDCECGTRVQVCVRCIFFVFSGHGIFMGSYIGGLRDL